MTYLPKAKNFYIKFIYSEKATKFCEISTLDLSYVVPVKSTVQILQNFVAFSEYMYELYFAHEPICTTVCQCDEKFYLLCTDLKSQLLSYDW